MLDFSTTDSTPPFSGVRRGGGMEKATSGCGVVDGGGFPSRFRERVYTVIPPSLHTTYHLLRTGFPYGGVPYVRVRSWLSWNIDRPSLTQDGMDGGKWEGWRGGVFLWTAFITHSPQHQHHHHPPFLHSSPKSGLILRSWPQPLDSPSWRSQPWQSNRFNTQTRTDTYTDNGGNEGRRRPAPTPSIASLPHIQTHDVSNIGKCETRRHRAAFRGMSEGFTRVFNPTTPRQSRHVNFSFGTIIHKKQYPTSKRSFYMFLHITHCS